VSAAVGTAQEVRAEAKWVRASARKARLVLEHIRGRTVPEARTVLAFSDRAVARDIERVLRSAVANAEANHGLAGDELVVVAAYADEGPTLKRWRARARGRIGRIHKRTCHITVRLAPTAERAVRSSAPAEGGRASREAAPGDRPRRERSRRERAANEAVPKQSASMRQPPTPRRTSKRGS
jgi:large subunit ribosomal protein L22